MKRYLPFAIIAAVAIAVVAGGKFLYQAKVTELASAASSTATDASAANVDAKSGADQPHIRGKENAPVTLEEFGDFQCPPCGIVAASLARIESDYGPKLRVIFREFPLAMHNHAHDAAKAAEAAGKQGHFWQMHDMLYRNQLLWSQSEDVATVFRGYAESLELDLDRFSQDFSSPQVLVRITSDQERGKSLNVNSTPTIFINDHLLPPSSLTEQGLRGAIDAALRGEPPPTPAPVATVAPVVTPTPPPSPSESPVQ